MSDRVRITEVGPRDGLQNEPGIVPTAEKVRLVELCAATGVDEIEVTSFVSPKWVPQLGDATQVFDDLRGFSAEHDHPPFSALVPNDKGMTAAIEVARTPLLLEKIAVFTAASEAFARKNINAGIDESFARFTSIIGMARNSSPTGALRVRGYVSCAIACPFEGPVAPKAVASVVRSLLMLGCDEVDLGDTIGAATPETTRSLLTAVLPEMGSDGSRHDQLTLHLHDTNGRAADCVRAALDMGVRSFDGSVAGIGGCPYASTPGKRAPGNISTETLVRTVHAAGYHTGVDLDRLRIAAGYALEIVGRSRAAAGGAL